MMRRAPAAVVSARTSRCVCVRVRTHTHECGVFGYGWHQVCGVRWCGGGAAARGGEADNAQRGLPSGICIKANSLEDKAVIDALYKASQAGVPIRLVVRSICCLRPQRAGLSENIAVRSIVGDFLEHTRIYYFHNNGDAKVYGGSADIMVRSFDRRIESLFFLADPRVKQQAILILAYNLRDNVNAYELNEDGSFRTCDIPAGSQPFDIHERFFDVTEKEAMAARLFDPEAKSAEIAEIEEEYQEGAERAIADI